MKNNYFKLNALFPPLLLLAFLCSCSTTRHWQVGSAANQKIVHDLAFNEVIGYVLHDSSTSVRKIYVDPVLKFRGICGNKRKVPSRKFEYFDFPDDYEIKFDRNPAEFGVSKLQIPDSLTNKLEYFTENTPYIRNDSVAYFFFSPLLPTRKKNIYMIHACRITSYTELPAIITYGDRLTLLYYIKGKKSRLERKFMGNLDLYTN